MISLRKLGLIRKDTWANVEKQLDRIITDIQANFTTLAQEVDQVTATVPAPGTVAFLVLDENAEWQLYTLVAGSGVTLTLDSGLKTLTISSP